MAKDRRTGRRPIPVAENVNADAVSWSQASAYTNVSIGAYLWNVTGPYTSVWYLTDAIGPGTTVSDEIATASVTVGTPGGPCDTITSDCGLVSIFSGLTLGPGTYYLSAGGGDPNPGAWAFHNVTSSGDILAADVTDNGAWRDGVYSSPYLPADITYTWSPPGWSYSVTGDPTPEPAPLALFTLGAVALLFLKSIRVRRSKAHSSGLD